jgi:hypothetical protein
MNAETLRDFVRAQPFEPFRIRTSNGEIHEIQHPECIMIGATRRWFITLIRTASFSAP